MSSMVEAARLIKKEGIKTFVEVGVWAGDMTKYIIKRTDVERVWAIDPWMASFNDFSYKGEDLPRKLKDKGRYQCRMGTEEPRSQEEMDKLYRHVLNRFASVNKCTIMRLTSEEASKRFDDNSVDFVFIDAIHLYDFVKQDINLWYPKVKVGGFIGGDDHYDSYPGVQKAVAEAFGNAKVDRRMWYVRKDG